MSESTKERDLLIRLLALTDREDGYYVLKGCSRVTGTDDAFELVGDLEQLFDDVVQLLVDGGDIDE